MNDTPSPNGTTTVTIRNRAGEILLYSWSDFVTDICEGTACFICGRAREEVGFNKEHILPDWLLHWFGLHKKTITLPNGNPTVYGNYTIPCCKTCNDNMSRVFELKMAPLVKAGPGAIQDYIVENGSLLVYTWMALIFLKQHLKDRRLRKHLNNNDGDDPISADYVWEHMHHLHAVARAFHIRADVQPEAIGSLYVFPVDGGHEDFDLQTFTEQQTLYLQLGQTGIVAVFDDSCAALNRVMQIIDRITGPVSPAQGRELAVHFAMANSDLLNRPHFWTYVSADRDHVTIGGTTDTAPVFLDFDNATFGGLMKLVFTKPPQVRGMTSAQSTAMMARGELTFLFDAKGNFRCNRAHSGTDNSEGS